MAKQDWNADFESLARQYWSGWNEMMRQAAGTPASPFAGMGSGFAPAGFSMPGFGAPAFGANPFAGGYPGAMAGMQGMGGWQDALAQWSRFAQSSMGLRQPDLADTFNDTLGRFQQQAGDWYGRMQQVAGEFAGQAIGAADIVERWKQMLEQGGENAWLEMFRSMQSPQAHGFDAWYEMVQPMLEQWRNEARGWLGTPAFGVGREHQERLQQLMQAQLDYQDTLAAHNALLAKSMQEAYANFERRLGEHEAPGLEITSARALFDLWIDAAEEAFASMALSTDYREVYGAMVNAQMRLRQDVQQQVEQATGLVGMPTRTEIEAAHRKIAELERIVRRMMRGDAPSPSRREPTPRPAATPARGSGRKVATKSAGKPAARKAVPKKAAAKSVAKKAASKKAASKEAASKKAASKKAASKKAAKKTTSAARRGGRR